MSGIQSKKFMEALSLKGINEVFHANSVATACLFIRKQALLSRGSVELRGYLQTPQKSDKADRQYSIWFDVFVDSTDIHERAGRHNEYGPVTFVFDTSIIEKTYTGRVWATKINPIYWAGKQEHQRWFQDIYEVEVGFTKGRFEHMIVLRHCGGELPFESYLKKIILDDPKSKNDDDIQFYSMAYGALRSAMNESRIKIPIERRECSTRCRCKIFYRNDSVKTNLMFDPFI